MTYFLNLTRLFKKKLYTEHILDSVTSITYLEKTELKLRLCQNN